MSLAYLDIMLKVVQIFAALLVGVAAVWVSMLQYNVNKTKLRIELYERRLEVFRATKKILYQSIHLGSLDLEDTHEFLNTCSDAEFLFNEIVSKHIEFVFFTATDILRTSKRIDRNRKIDPTSAPEYLEELFSHKKKLQDKYDIIINDFKPFLKLGV